MLRMDISTLKRSELRSLLKAARGRGQEDLADQLEAELSARADDRPVVAPEARSWAVEADEVLPMEVPEPDLYFDVPATEPPTRRRPGASSCRPDRRRRGCGVGSQARRAKHRLPRTTDRGRRGAGPCGGVPACGRGRAACGCDPISAAG